LSAIPEFQDMMLPVLEIIKDGRPYGYTEVERQINARLGISEREQEKLTEWGHRVVY